MSSEYLRKLTDLVEKDPSQIKLLIQDLPNILLNTTEPQLLLFSSLSDPEDRKLLCHLLNRLVKRLSVSARRSKQAFTSMWDKLKLCLEIILKDALAILTEKDQDTDLEILLRRILQIGGFSFSNPASINGNGIGSLWLAMDLDVQLRERRFTRTLALNFDNLESELNQKTLFLYCQQFTTLEFPKTILEINDPSADLISLYFKKYYCTETTSQLICKCKQCSFEFIQQLKMIQSGEWIEFEAKVIENLLSKLQIVNSDAKEACAIFDLLTEMTIALDLKADNSDLLKLLCGIQGSIAVDSLSDSSQSKYWYFVSALLSCDGIEGLNLDNGIIFTLQSDDLVKATTSVCRVIALYWNNLADKELVTESLLDSIIKYDNNKLRWNVAIALMNIEGTAPRFNRIKEFWMGELEKLGNFKVMLSYGKLLQKWSNDCDSSILWDGSEVEKMWETLNWIKAFILENVLNLEREEDEILVVENGRKLVSLLRSILIGGEDT